MLYINLVLFIGTFIYEVSQYYVYIIYIKKYYYNN